MQISELAIERFGVWQQLSLPLKSPGINVFYGPNEAGKTTMMRFVRSILFGLQPADSATSPRRGRVPVWSGSLIVEHEDDLFDIRRAGRPDAPHGRLWVSGFDDDRAAHEQLDELLQGVTRDLYQHVFSIDLQELQELSTLDGSELAQRIYDLTLGPRGQALLHATHQVRSELDRLAAPQEDSGLLMDVLARRERVRARLHGVEDLREHFTTTLESQRQLQASIAELQERRSEIQQQLRGHVFLDRVWTPWNRVREFERELQQLPEFHAFPHNGLERIEELDKEISAAETLRDAARQQAQGLKESAAALVIRNELAQHAAAVQGLVDQTDWILKQAARAAELEANYRQHRELLEDHASCYGDQWSTEQLTSVETSPNNSVRLWNAAQAAARAARRQRRIRRKVARLEQRGHQQQARLDSFRRSLRGRTIAQALEETHNAIQATRQSLQAQAATDARRQQKLLIEEQLQRLEHREELPPWINQVMSVFTAIGALLIVVGILNATWVSGLAGAIFILLGCTWFGVRFGLKRHLDSHVAGRHEELRRELDALEAELDDEPPATIPLTERPRAERHHESGLTRPQHLGTTAQPLELRLESLLKHLTELQQFALVEQNLQKRNEAIARLRIRRDEGAQEFQASRHHWYRVLEDIGLEKTGKLSDAFQNWQAALELVEVRQDCERAARERDFYRELLQDVRSRIRQVGRAAGLRSESESLADLLSAWRVELQTLEQHQSERRRLRREERQQQQEAQDFEKLIEECRMEQKVILVQAGARDRDEFEHRALQMLRRAELQELLEQARRDLEHAAAAEPELAIVEDDLVAFDSADNTRRVEVLNQQLDALQQDERTAYERLGQLKQELTELEQDHSQLELRFQLAQIDAQITQIMQSWLSLKLADDAVDGMRADFERAHQSETLIRASAFLAKLTRGRYPTIWAPLGERRLCVSDDQQNSFHIDQLSGATREQLFLAVRLALIEEFAEQGVRMPIVLDDILVNFDQLRTEAALETLLELAEQGHQLLFFTCHLHLAHLLESRGVEPTWLPGHHAAMEERQVG